MIEYEIYRQRNAELREIAANERLVREARQANRQANRAARPQAAGSRLGRLAAGLRRPATRADRSATTLAEC